MLVSECRALALLEMMLHFSSELDPGAGNINHKETGAKDDKDRIGRISHGINLSVDITNILRMSSSD